MDENLIERIKNNDQEAFRDLYDFFSAYALRTAYAITGNDASASDAVQEAFIRVYYHIGSYDDSKPFKPWFYRILVNECNRLMKKTAKITLLSDYIGSNSDFESRDNYKFQEYEELYNALKKLKDAQRIPIVLKYLSGFTDEETAHILDINVNTLKSRVHKGKEKLRKIIENSFEGGLKNGQR